MRQSCNVIRLKPSRAGTAIALWLETARAEGYPIPEPAGRTLARS